MRALSLVFLAFLGFACKSSVGFKGAGETCHSATECGPGLLCDLGRDPPVCAGDLTRPPDAGPDAMPPVIDSGPDGPLVPDAMPMAPDAAVVIDAAVTIDAL